MKSLHQFFVVLVFSSALGCNAASESTHCEESARTVSASMVSALVGLSADELLEQVGDEHVFVLQFTNEHEILSQQPAGSETELTLRLVYDDGEVREIDSVFVAGDNDIGLECSPRLELDLRVEVSTADGSLNEVWDGVLSSHTSPYDGDHTAMILAEFSPDLLQGSAQIVSFNNPSNPESVTGQLMVYFGETSTGEIDIRVESSASGGGDDASTSLAVHRMAVF